MNNKGFTLIELLATITLLAIISVISYVSINGIINESKRQNCKTLKTNIMGASKEYVSDNRYESNFISKIVMDGDNKYVMIYANELISGHYLKGEIKDPFSDDVIDPSDISIKVYFKKDYSAGNVEVYYNSAQINCDSDKLS